MIIMLRILMDFVDLCAVTGLVPLCDVFGLGVFGTCTKTLCICRVLMFVTSYCYYAYEVIFFLEILDALVYFA